jgi:hypothetical protein
VLCASSDDKGRQSRLFPKKTQQKDFIFRDQPNHPAKPETVMRAET